MLKRERSIDYCLIYLVGFIFFGLPALTGYGAVPLTNFTAEALCPTGLALMLVIAGFRSKALCHLAMETRVALAAFGLLGLVTCIQFFMLQQRQIDAYLVILGYFFCAAIALWLGHHAAADSHPANWGDAAAACVALAAVLAAFASVAQYFEIDAQAMLISPAKEVGRTYGFFRQPNQQGTFLNMGLVALFSLYRTGRLRLWAWLALSFFVVFGMVTTGSRTALMQIAFISFCSLALPSSGKMYRFKALLPLVAVVVIWAVLYVVGHSGGAEFYGSQKLDQTLSEGIGMRSAVWHQTLLILFERPWMGVGILRYPSEFFLHGSGMEVRLNMSHSHNLFLQLAVDFGLPVASLFCIAISWVFWRTRANWLTNYGFLAAMILGCLLIHSLFEFPFWYTYFLLPGCWFLGWLTYSRVAASNLGSEIERAVDTPFQRGRLTIRVACLLVSGLILSVILWMNRDYFRLTPAFAPGLASTEGERVQDTRKAFWFSQFSEFAQLQVQPVTAENASVYMRRAAALGCVMPEIWFQTGTMVALAQTGHVDDAKWILYIVSKMTKGHMNSYRNGIAGRSLLVTEQLLAYIDNPVPVQRSVQSFTQACLAK